jgi:hypothetical protein
MTFRQFGSHHMDRTQRSSIVFSIVATRNASRT